MLAPELEVAETDNKYLLVNETRVSRAGEPRHSAQIQGDSVCYT